MSDAFFGWGLGALDFPAAGSTPPPPVPIDSSLSIRARIIQHLALTLELVQQLRATAEPANTSAVEFAAGGAYTGSVTRKYRVAVTVAGASGTAQVTVTDASPAALRAFWTQQDAADTGYIDDGPADHVVTSGAAIDLGDAGYGATLTLTFAGALVVGDVWYVYVGPYQTSVEHVARKMDTRDAGTWIEIQGPSQSSEPGPLPLQSNSMELTLWCYVPRVDDPEEALERFLADVTNAVRLDPTRGALAVNTLPQGDVAIVLDAPKARSWLVLRLLIQYRHRDNDTSSL